MTPPKFAAVGISMLCGRHALTPPEDIMNRFLTLAAALVCACVFTQSARAGGPPPSFEVDLVGVGSSFAGGMTTVTASLVATVGSTHPFLEFGATFAAPVGFTGGFSPLGVAPFGNIMPQLITSLGGFCDAGDTTTECLFPLTFSALGPAGGMFGATATLADGFDPVTQNANFSVPVSVPEPASLALLSVALLGAGLARRKSAR